MTYVDYFIYDAKIQEFQMMESIFDIASHCN